MPWKIQKRGGMFCVIKESDNSIEKCHSSRADALAHMRALYASEGKNMDNDAMIYFGGEVKALNDSGLVGGYLVRFQPVGSKQKDLSGEFFTAKTYLGPKDGDGAESLFDHGYPIPIPDGVDVTTKNTLLALADHTFAPLKTKRDAVGIWAEVVLNLADDYEKHVYGMVQKKKLGWSSGSAGHRVRKNANGEITAWPIAEGSLTPCPCEPMNRAISMKSLGSVKFVPIEDPEEEDEPDVERKLVGAKSLAGRLTQFIEDSIDEGYERDDTVKKLAREALMDVADVEKVLTGEVNLRGARLKAFARVLQVPYETLRALSDKSEARTIKGMFEDELASQQPSVWMLWDVFRCVTKKIAEAKASTLAAGTEFDEGPKIEEAISELSTRLKSVVTAQIADYASNDDDEFYLKTFDLSSPEVFRSVTEQMPMDEHLRLVGTAEEDLVARFTANADRPHGKSTKAGRELSNKNRQRLMKLQQMHKEHSDAVGMHIQKLLDDTKPMASEIQKRAAYLNHLRVKGLVRESFGGLNG
jgi:hypothetical protein